MQWSEGLRRWVPSIDATTSLALPYKMMFYDVLCITCHASVKMVHSWDHTANFNADSHAVFKRGKRAASARASPAHLPSGYLT